MNLKHKLKDALIAFAMAIGAMLMSGTVFGASLDMVDVSNHNGYMTTAEYVDMRDNYGVKAVTVKISEGTFYQDKYGASNIQNVQNAKLYVNAYHYTHYTNVTQAVAEANYAGQTAKRMGLPIGAVLAADVEAPEYNSVPRYTLDKCNEAFMNVIRQYGYRPDVYTMGSWVNSKMTVNNGTGWIAHYVGNAYNKHWYQNNHAWQYKSTMQFRKSYGNFDVNELHDDYYTANQKPVNPSKPADPVKPTPKPQPVTSWTDSLGDRWYSEKATYRLNTPTYLRWGAKTSSSALALLPVGSTIKYDAFSIHNGYVWIRQPRGHGQYAYIATGQAINGKRINYWGSFK